MSLLNEVLLYAENIQKWPWVPWVRKTITFAACTRRVSSVRPLELSNSVAYAYFALKKCNVCWPGTWTCQKINKQLKYFLKFYPIKRRVMLGENISKFCRRERSSHSVALKRSLHGGLSSNCVPLARDCVALMWDATCFGSTTLAVT